jgi:hypothetical protein
MLGDREKAVQHYRAAAARTTSLPEQNYLIAQAARLEEAHNDSNSKPAGLPPS